MYNIPLIKPFVSREIKVAVEEVLDSGYWTEGPVTRELEAAFSAVTGAKEAVAVSNCTVGLETALRAIRIGPGDEVIVPDYTYPATAAAVAIVGARIVLVDVDPTSMLMDFNRLEEAITEHTKAIMPVSIFGNPLHYERLWKIQEKTGIKIIEDAACAIGATYQNRPVGSLADITVFSLHPRKFITTGEGGMVTTNNETYAAWIQTYKHFGAVPASYREGIVFETIGTNYKLSNLQAAVGLGQMRVFDELLAKRRYLANRYKTLLAEAEDVLLPITMPGGQHAYQSFCVFIRQRDRVMKTLRAQGIEVQIGTYALHREPAYQESAHCRWYGRFPGSAKAYEESLVLPLFHDMTDEQQDIVVRELLAAIRKEC